MKLLVTGGAGFIGSKLCLILLKENHEITTIDNLSSGHIENIPDGVNFINGDCSDDNLINNIITKYDAIIHLAAQSGGEGSFYDVIYDINTNAKATLLLLELARRTKCNRFIFTSTVAVYGGINGKSSYSEDDVIDPHTFYAVNKLTSEYYMKIYQENYNINYTTFRLFNCYGPGQNLDNLTQGMVSIYLRQFIDDKIDKILIKGSLDRYRDLIYIDDVTNILNDSILNNNFFNKILNLGTGKQTTVKYLLDTIKYIGKYTKPITVEGTTPGDMIGVVANISKLQEIYNNNYKFITVEKGLTNMIEDIDSYIFTIK
jgi:UDP-glucose 4-epimerase